MTTRGAAKRPATAGRIVVGARACNACSGTPRCAVVTSAAFACWLTTLMSMTVKSARLGELSGRRVRRARPSEPRAGTVTPLSVRTLTGGDVGIGRDVRPSYVQVGAGARMYGFTTRGGRGLPSIRALDNMDTPSPPALPRPALVAIHAAAGVRRRRGRAPALTKSPFQATVVGQGLPFGPGTRMTRIQRPPSPLPTRLELFDHFQLPPSASYGSGGMAGLRGRPPFGGAWPRIW